MSVAICERLLFGLRFRVEPGMTGVWYIILFFYPFVFDISPYKGKAFRISYA